MHKSFQLGANLFNQQDNFLQANRLEKTLKGHWFLVKGLTYWITFQAFPDPSDPTKWHVVQVSSSPSVPSPSQTQVQTVQAPSGRYDLNYLAFECFNFIKLQELHTSYQQFNLRARIMRGMVKLTPLICSAFQLRLSNWSIKFRRPEIVEWTPEDTP